MRIGEEGAVSGQAVNIRCLGLRVTPEAARPIIKVIDGDEQDIGLLGPLDGKRDQREDQSEKFHGYESASQYPHWSRAIFWSGVFPRGQLLQGNGRIFTTTMRYARFETIEWARWQAAPSLRDIQKKEENAFSSLGYCPVVLEGGG